MARSGRPPVASARAVASPPIRRIRAPDSLPAAASLPAEASQAASSSTVTGDVQSGQHGAQLGGKFDGGGDRQRRTGQDAGGHGPDERTASGSPSESRTVTGSAR